MMILYHKSKTFKYQFITGKYRDLEKNLIATFLQYAFEEFGSSVYSVYAFEEFGSSLYSVYRVGWRVL